MYFYSGSTGGFYLTEVHGDAMPSDAVSVSDERHSELLLAQRNGQRIISDSNGQPVAADHPPAPAPRVVTMRQARLALLEAGRLADVNHAIAALEGSAQAAALIEWEYAQTVERDSPFVAQLASALELGDDALNDLFELAATL